MLRTRVGYSGGTREHPTYRKLGDHTEAVWIEFDPRTITYRDLLEVFWKAHAPYGPKRSTQYKAVLWTHGKTQAATAESFVAEKTGKSKRKLRTEIRAASRFWIAEAYHQKYRLRRHPKLMKALFGAKVEDDVLRDSTLAARVNGWLDGHGDEDAIRAEMKSLGLDDAKRKALERALP